VAIAAVKGFRHDASIEVFDLFRRNPGMALLTAGLLGIGRIEGAKKKKKNRC